MLLALACSPSVGFDLDVDLFPGNTAPTEVPDSSPFEVALFDERPEAVLPAFLDLETYGPLLLADRARAAEGDGFATVAVTDVQFAVDAPLHLTFEVQSLDGRWHVLGDETGAAELPACAVTVEADTAPEAHADAVLACLRATTEARGGAVDFSVTVRAETTDDDWEYRAVYALGADRPVDVACTGPMEITDELREQAGSTQVVVEELSLAGYAAAVEQGAAVVAFAATWPSHEEPPVAGAWGGVRVEAGAGRFVGAEVEVAETVPATIAFGGPVGAVAPWPGDWAAVAMDNLLAGGFLETCDVRVHDARPNTTYVELALVGAGTASRE